MHEDPLWRPRLGGRTSVEGGNDSQWGEGKIDAIEGKIDAAHDAAAAVTLRAERGPLVIRRNKLEDDMKQLRAIFLALQQEKTAKEQQLAEYQHEKNLLLEAQQRAQQSSSSGQFVRHRMQA